MLNSLDTTKRKVLIIDDNNINVEILNSVLLENNFETFIAYDGNDGLKLTHEIVPDVILLDIEMPGMDGFEVCRAIKSETHLSEIPVIFITASDLIDDTVEGFNSGAADYISRPIKMREVLVRVQNQIAICDLRKANEEERVALEMILSSLPMPYFIAKIEDGQLMRINHYACDRLGIDINNFEEYSSIDFYANPRDREKLLETVKLTGSFSNREVELKDSKGEIFTALYNATPLEICDEDVFFVTFNDISKRKHMEEALERMANTDYLTEIANRRFFTEQANAERARANRNDTLLCLMMIDVDRFKKINDTYGHDIGDFTLKELVKVIGEHLRVSDVLGRLGGEEFALLLPETNFEGAKILAERIRQRVEEHVLQVEDGVQFNMTISIGLAAWQKGQTLDDMFKITDKRLYEAKQTGRNKVISS